MKRWASLCVIASLLWMSTTSTASAFCWWWDYDWTGSGEYSRTKYPIVLVHGAFGFDSVRILGVDILDYWYDLDSALADCSGASVHVVQVSPSHTVEYRGEQLLAQIQNVVARTGKSKVNIIAHSVGGLDARYVMKVRPDLVASITTIASPHKGGGTFESFLGGLNADGSPTSGLINFMGDAMELLWGVLTGYEGAVDPMSALSAQLPSRAAAWNEAYPGGVPSTSCGEGAATHNGIRLYSWAGNAAVPWTSSLNPLAAADLTFNTLFGVIEELSPDDTDGFVERCSGHFGDVLRDDYDWNHLDEINQLWGITADFEVDPKVEFRKQANRLKNAGL